MDDLIHTDQGHGRSRHILQWLDAHTSGLTANDGASTGGEDDQGFTNRLYQLCLHTLQDFCCQQRDQRGSKSRYHALREFLGRLYLWGEPFGLGELDKAVEQSDELKYSVIERLGHIGKLLLRKSAQWVPPSNALYQQGDHIKELKCVIEQGNLIASAHRDQRPNNGHENEYEYASGEEGLSDSSSYDTVEDIGFATTCLLELGPSLQQNISCAESARNQRSYRTDVPFSVSTPGRIYAKLVREKFPQAHDNLVGRLGESNWQRHQDIRQQMDSSKLTPHEMVNLGKKGLAKSLFYPYSDFHDSGIGTSVPAQTDYAPSHTSFRSSNNEGEHVSLRVPREPSEVAAGKPFQCFFCRCIISNVKNRIDWKMHVFADLRPYICTFSDCKDELAQFTTRAAWAVHEFTEHRYDATWHCPECSEALPCVSDWEKHLQEMHGRVFTGPQLHIARMTAYETRQRQVEKEECPLCHIVLGKPRRAFVKHTARHMEEIALMALPRSTEEDSDESSISTNQISQGSNIDRVLAAEIQSEAREGMSIHGTKGSASDRSAANGSASSINVHSQGPRHAPDDEVEDYLIKCICGLREDDGNRVSCYQCHTWQHSVCYYSGSEPTTTELELINHVCVECLPGSFSAKQAIDLQMKLLKEVRVRRAQLCQNEQNLILQNGGNDREEATIPAPETPFPPYDEFEDPAKPFLCKIAGCPRAHLEHAFRRRDNLLTHMKKAHGYSTSEASNESHSLPSKFEDSGDFAGADVKKRRGQASAPGTCHSCNTSETTEWRRGPDGPRTLCNACGLHYAELTRNTNRKVSTSPSLSHLQSEEEFPSPATTPPL